MKSPNAISALSALAHEHRLAIFRMLVARGPEGLSAGEIAERLGVQPSSLTFHTQALMRAGLIEQQRASRQLFYSANFAAMNDLVDFLTENCCEGASSTVCATACKPGSSAKRMRRKARTADRA